MSERAPQPLDLFACPLDTVCLIEASAGTGKTWNICGLVLRLLLERGLSIDQVLVVTFTNAATAELRERIRRRLVEVRDVLRGVARADAFVDRLLQAPGPDGAPLDPAQRAAMVEAALESFDQAAIFTIHGFCQRALADAAFAAQAPLRAELLADDSALRLRVVNDFWRRRVAVDGLAPPLLARMLGKGDTPERFAAQLAQRMARPRARVLWPQGIETAQVFDDTALRAAFATARPLWQSARAEAVACLLSALPALNAQSYKPESVQAGALEWDALFQTPDPLSMLSGRVDKATLFSAARIASKTKKKIPPGVSAPVHPFFEAAQAVVEAYAVLERAAGIARLQLLRDLFEEAPSAIAREKRRLRVVAYDDMLANLADRLASPEGDALAARLRGRYRAALIDEFQDTDPLQFEIFQRIHGDTGGPLFLVGDPKQSIYGFRNADLHTYLRAREHTSAEYTLGENQRACGPLIDALNRLFAVNRQVFMLDGLHFRPVGVGSKPRVSFDDPAGALAPLQFWQLPGLDDANALLPAFEARQVAAQASAAEIVRLLAQARSGAVRLDGAPLRAGDIAVLVRTHAEGAVMRQALAERGVGCVERSQRSVFETPDAEALERVLAAVNEPARDALVRAALATEAMGFDASALQRLSGDEAASAAAAEGFAQLRRDWAARGVAFMLRSWLRTHGVVERMLSRPDGERRMTNLLHLFECLHEASEMYPAPDALLHWLRTRRADPGTDEQTQLRLESDAHLVQIVTVHAAKGLEYPVVFCPFLWAGARAAGGPGLEARTYHDDDGVLLLDYRDGLDDAFDDKRVRALQRVERDAEFLRLVYVALTRAAHRCVVVVGCHTVRGSATASARGLLNWMVLAPEVDPQDWAQAKPTPAQVAEAWRALAANAPGCVGLAALPEGGRAALQPEPPAPGGFVACALPRPVPAAWRIGSYSGLAHGIGGDGSAADHDYRIVRSTAPLPESVEADDILRFPRGPAAGDCLHALLEQAEFTDPTHWDVAIASALDGLPEQPEDRRDAGPRGSAARTALRARRARMLRGLLDALLHTALPLGTEAPLRLATLEPARRLAEMEFHLPSAGLRHQDLEAVLARHGYARPGLDFPALTGFLKGFIDLVFEHQGRYFVLDWKSNRLGHLPDHYDRDAMDAEIARHAYHLQALLYSVALHRHLGRRLPDYDPARHFGGAVYLFVRAVRPDWRTANGAPAGVWFHRPSDAALAQLDALFPAAEVVHG